MNTSYTSYMRPYELYEIIRDYTSYTRLYEIIRVIRGHTGLYEIIRVIFKLSESELRSYKLSYTCRVIYI